MLAGGLSNEREISLRSGRAVHGALASRGINAIFMDVAGDIYDIIGKNRIDVAFVALHGRFGEDGTVQEALEKFGVPYTGSGPRASRLALDKIASKEIFIRSGIPTPGYRVVQKGGVDGSLRGMDMPVVVKPQWEGSSIGLSIVSEADKLDSALEKAMRYGPGVIVESYVEGRELTVGILDDEPLPVLEIVTGRGVYDFEAKYSDPETRYIVPAPIDKSLAARARALGVMAHKALGCASFSRVDMIMDRSGEMYVLEVNTIPGMTERSLLPKAAASAGIGFDELCVRLVNNAYASKGGYEKAKKD